MLALVLVLIPVWRRGEDEKAALVALMDPRMAVIGRRADNAQGDGSKLRYQPNQDPS